MQNVFKNKLSIKSLRQLMKVNYFSEIARENYAEK